MTGGVQQMDYYRKDMQVGYIVESRPCCTCHFCPIVLQAGPYMLTQSNPKFSLHHYRVTPFQCFLPCWGKNTCLHKGELTVFETSSFTVNDQQLNTWLPTDFCIFLFLSASTIMG